MFSLAMEQLTTSHDKEWFILRPVASSPIAIPNLEMLISNLSFGQLLTTTTMHPFAFPIHMTCIIGEHELICEIIFALSIQALQLSKLETFTFLIPTGKGMKE
jgi:hypothetical protein